MNIIGKRGVFKKTLCKNDRIKKRQEIKNLLNQGIRVVYPKFKIIYKENGKDRDRFAVIISKKCGKANIRNKTKRFYREIFRENKINNPPFFDILVLPKIGIIRNDENNASTLRTWLQKIKK